MSGNLINTLQQLQRVAAEMDVAPLMRLQLSNMENNLTHRQFYLPIVGQFSAGKSHFINNLLDRDLLPTKTTETTSFLTTIRYGEQEQLKVKTVSGDEAVYEVSLAKELNHQNIRSGVLGEQLAEIELDDISVLDITLNNPLLVNGLVLVDTPGINTLLTAHESITYDFLPAAQAFIYVSGHQPSLSDINFLQCINQFGLEVFFVRTRLDEINQHEEDLSSVIEADCQILAQAVDTQQHYFAISNKLENPQWQAHFTQLRERIATYFARDVQSALEQAINGKIQHIVTELRVQLEHKAKIIQLDYQGEPEQLAADLAQLEQALTLSQNDEALIKERLEQEFALVKRETQRELGRMKTQVESAFNQTLSAAAWVDSPLKVKDFADQCVKKLAADINQHVCSRLTQSVALIYQQRKAQLTEVASISERLPLNAFSLDIALPTLADIESKTDEVLQAVSLQLSSLEQESMLLDESTAKLETDRQLISSEYERLTSDMADSKTELTQLEYVPQYVTTPGDLSVSDACSKLGFAIDLAIMFMPTPAGPAKAVVNTSKAANAVKKAKQGASILDKTKKAIEKYKPVVQQGAAGVRKAKQQAEQSAQSLANSQHRQEQELGHVMLNSLQLLEAEYWMRKLGEQFDRPPMTRLDLDHLRQFETLRAHAEQEMQAKVQKQLDALSSRGLLNEKIAYEQKKKELLLQRKAELEMEMAQLKEQAMQQQVTQQRQAQCHFYCQQMSGMLSDYMSLVDAELDEIIEAFMVKLSLSVTLDSQECIGTLNDQIAQLKGNQLLSEQEKQQQLAIIAAWANELDALNV